MQYSVLYCNHRISDSAFEFFFNCFKFSVRPKSRNPEALQAKFDDIVRETEEKLLPLLD